MKTKNGMGEDRNQKIAEFESREASQEIAETLSPEYAIKEGR